MDKLRKYKRLNDIHHARFYDDQIAIVFNNKIVGTLNFSGKDFKDAFNFQKETLLNDLNEVGIKNEEMEEKQ